MRVAPHWYSPSLYMAACHGHAPGLEFPPPTILRPHITGVTHGTAQPSHTSGNRITGITQSGTCITGVTHVWNSHHNQHICQELALQASNSQEIASQASNAAETRITGATHARNTSQLQHMYVRNSDHNRHIYRALTSQASCTSEEHVRVKIHRHVSHSVTF